MVTLLVGGLLSLMATGIPIAICMLIIGIAYMIHEDIPMMVAAQYMTEGAMLNVLIAIPLYLLTGVLMNEVGMSHRVVRLCNAVVGHVRGGLAVVNVMACMIFAGMTGEAVAETAGLGSVMIPAMEKDGYDKPFASALTVTAAVIGPIIPPSVPMIICSALASLSVGRMFLGGMIPGILFGLFLMGLSYFFAIKRNYPIKAKTAKGEFWPALRDASFGLLTIFIILGGIFTGVFTPVEAAGIAAVYSFLVGLFIYKSLDLKKVPQMCLSVAVSTGVIMFIIAMAGLYTFVLTRAQIPQEVIKLVMGVSHNQTVLLLMVCIGLFILGCFLSTTPALLLVVPVLTPLVQQAGFHPIHFWVVIVLALLLGTLTPPVGINLYLVTSISGVGTGRLIKELPPFYLVLISVIFVAIFVPWIVTAPGDWIYGTRM
ncbi:MAG: TRAP transporter large permease [Deltaproteobacteria bacterium]|nr:TRAP transporter large permease [Deltaproteobacteria bacterium]